MSDTEHEVNETQQSEVTEPVEKKEPEKEPEVQAAQAAPTESPAYTPNFKFKVQKNEYEIDPLFHGVIKDADTEKKVKEIYQKAYGLDIVKSAYERDSQEFKNVKTAHQHVMTQLSDIKEDYERGNMEGVFTKLGIPKEKVLQWLVNEAQYSELGPEQQDLIKKQRLAEERAYALEKQNMQSQQSYESLQAQIKRLELERVLDKPDVKSFSDEFDAKAGQPGAFWNAVAEHGEMVALTRKIDLTAEQAVNEVMKRYGMFYSKPQSQQAQGPTQTNQQSQSKPPVIPNISGKSHAPVDRSPKSIEDLKKIAQQLQ